MKEITLKEILDMQPQQVVDFLTSLDMQDRMELYSTLLDRHKEFLAEQIEKAMGCVTFADIAQQAGISENTDMTELERLAKEEENAAAQYYLALAFLDRWKKEHPFAPLPEDFVNEQPSMEAIRNDWETARKWAIDCTEQGFKQGFYAQALCYDCVLLPPYYAKKNADEYHRCYPIVRYEQVVTEKHDPVLALKAACRLAEIYSGRAYEELDGIDEMRAEIADKFRFKCREAKKFDTDECRVQAEYALDNLRFYDEQRIAAAEKLAEQFPEKAELLGKYRVFHERQLAEIRTEF